MGSSHTVVYDAATVQGIWTAAGGTGAAGVMAGEADSEGGLTAAGLAGLLGVAGAGELRFVPAGVAVRAGTELGVVFTVTAGVSGDAAPTTTVVGGAPVYQGASPRVCKYSIFGHTMESQFGLLTSPPVSPEFAFHANQKKLVMGLCSSSIGLPSLWTLRMYCAKLVNRSWSASSAKVVPNSPIAIAKM